MRQKFFLFLLSPLFLFATIEIAKEPAKKPPTKTLEKAAPKEEAASVATTTVTAEKKTTASTPAPAPVKTTVVKKKEVVRKATPQEVSLSETPQNEEDYPKSAATVPSYLNDGHGKQFFLTLIIICAFILFGLIVIYIFKRASPMSAITRKNSRNNIKILERRSLSPQTYLYHVQVGDKQFILSESKVEVRSVATLDWTDPK
ncbi:flagellar biosynthetic protein FliO [bacterium]|nr:flagellar biosynthetic protein FliO [bacterium]